jgi:hypothetical protein
VIAHTERGVGTVKSFSCAVLRSVGLPGEERVAAMSVLKHGVVPRMALTLTPNSVKWFAGRVVMTLPC